MLFKIITILPVVSIFVHGTALDHQPHAVSTQSYHRGDVPLSYKFTSVHIYTTPQPEHPARQQHINPNRENHRENPKYRNIQYAPIVPNTYLNDIYSNKHIPEQENGHVQITEQEIPRSTEFKGKKLLEPRANAEDLRAHDQHYRSYVPGHNIEVLQSNRALGYNDLYRDYHDKLQNQKVNIPNEAIIHRKPEQHFQLTSKNFRAAEQRPLTEEHNILYTLLPKALDKTQYNIHTIERPHYLHQALSAKIPRLHLNIARVYGIAHIPQQAPINTPNHNLLPYIAKPPSHTQAIFLPLKSPTQKKTILYPVQDNNKNYPVVT